MLSTDKLRSMANAIRRLAVERDGAGGPVPGDDGCAAEIATVLFARFLDFDPKRANWPDRDRFVHLADDGRALDNILLTLTGYPEVGSSQGRLAPTRSTLRFAEAVGLAIAERRLAAEFGEGIVDHRTYLLAGEGLLADHVGREAMGLAGRLGLGRLMVLRDDATLRDTDEDAELGEARAWGWNTLSCDGRDFDSIAQAIESAEASERPTLVACRAAPRPTGESAPSDVAPEILDKWRLTGLRSAARRRDWEERLAVLPPETRGEFERRMRGELRGEFAATIGQYKHRLQRARPEAATFDASARTLSAVDELLPETLNQAASDDGTRAEAGPHDVCAARLLDGVGEEAFAAVMNGIALHGGFLPRVDLPSPLTDDGRAAIRLSAGTGQRIVFVIVEDDDSLPRTPADAQALHATPGLAVFRPADAVEVAECWQLALKRNGPSLLILSRQAVPTLRRDEREENRCARGAYEIVPASAEPRATIFAAGSLVPTAVAARDLLEAAGSAARVVSVPCFELFRAQSLEYRKATIALDSACVSVGEPFRHDPAPFDAPEGSADSLRPADAGERRLELSAAASPEDIAAAVRAGLAAEAA